MWVWKMEKISWRDMKTNEEVLQTVQEERSLMGVIRRRTKNWISHIILKGERPAERGDRGLNGGIKTKGKETIECTK